MAVEMTKDQVLEAVKGLPETFTILYEKHGYDEKAIRIDHRGGVFFVKPEGKDIRLNCICLERRVSMLVSPLEAQGWIESVARSHECVPWPG